MVGGSLTPASSTTKTGRHDIAEILLKVVLKHQKSINQSIIQQLMNDSSLTINILWFFLTYLNFEISWNSFQLFYIHHLH